MADEKPWAAEQFAEYLGVTRDHVYRQCRARVWPHLRIGRDIRFTAEHRAAVLDLLNEPVIGAPTAIDLLTARARRAGRSAA